MTDGEIGSLEGVTLLYGPHTPAFNHITKYEIGPSMRGPFAIAAEVERQTMEVAYFAGATVICAAESEAFPSGPNVYWQNRAHRSAHQAIQELQAAHSEQIPSIPRIPFPALLADGSELSAVYTQMRAGNSFVIAYTAFHNGHIKYLVTEEDQLARFVHFIHEAMEWDERIEPKNFEIRPFIETPSNRYSSFRIVVDATGSMLAAGLLYSAQTKTEPLRRVQEDRFSDCPPTSIEYLIKVALEVPESPFFINGGDVRSNSATGGRIIALAGTNRKPYGPQDVAILEAHGIDPADAQPPPRLIETAQFIGRTVGPHVDLVLGIDFIGDLYSETNPDPHSGVFAACHMGGEGFALDHAIAMRRQALANLAAKHNPATAEQEN